MKTTHYALRAPHRTSLYVILSISILFSFGSLPAYAADIGVSPSPVTFENQQNLTFLASTTVPLLDLATSTLPIGIPISLSYAVGHVATWPNHSPSVSAAVNDELFAETLSEQRLYLDVWKGTPFSSTSTILQSFDISNKPTGHITFTLPSAGSYFLVAYFPDGFFQDPQSMCPNDDNWKEDCAPPSTLAQVQGYFAYPLNSPEFYQNTPDAFGGIQFSIPANNTAPVAFKSSNVLFLPGIEGSRLYMRNAAGKEQTLWEPQLLSSLDSLALTSNGSSIQNQVYTRDLVDYLYGQKALGDVYGPLEVFLNSLVSNGSIKKWQPYPYDWRRDVEDLVQNGTLVGQPTGAVNRVYLEDVVKNLASTSPSGKVSIIAHSNGGLLAKSLALYLAKKGESSLVDRIIFIGSPQFGTPLTIGSLLNGDGQTDATGGLIMYGGNVRQVAANMPGMYGLLPSAQYFTHVANHPVVFPGNPSTDLFAKNYGSSISSLSQLSSFLTDTFGLHANFPAADERTPQVLSNSILAEESSTHADLDSWNPPAGISTYAISGWGNLTPYEYDYTASPSKQFSCFRTDTFQFSCSYSLQVTHTAKSTEDGDNTVVSASAVGNIPTPTYFNAKSFSNDKKGKIGHGDLTSAQPIQTYLTNILTNKSTSGIAYLSSTTPNDATNAFSVVSVHSPMNIVATDAAGDQTGIFPVAGKPGIYIEKENIPGSTLQILDDEKYVYVPSGTPYTVSLKGYDDGLSTIDLGTLDAEGNDTTSEEFSELPTTANTSASFSVLLTSANSTASSGSASASTSSSFPTTINVDVFGNGSTTPIAATFTSGIGIVASSSVPQKNLPELFSILEHIGIEHHLNQKMIEAEFAMLQKDSPSNAGKEIDSLETKIELLMRQSIQSSEETLIIELLEEVRVALGASEHH